MSGSHIEVNPIEDVSLFSQIVKRKSKNNHK